LNHLQNRNPDLCLKWFDLVGKERKMFEDEIGVGQFGFEQAFGYHFKIGWKMLMAGP
jgi:hypothetical protein